MYKNVFLREILFKNQCISLFLFKEKMYNVCMSKYEKLWEYIKIMKPELMFFDEIEKVAGIPIDHSFLTYKKELETYGFKVSKISMKDKNIKIEKI